MKLTIAVQNQKKNATPLQEEVNYRWDRIIGTIGGAIALVALVVFVFFPGGQNPDIEQPEHSEHSARTDLPLFSASEEDAPAPAKQHPDEPAAALRAADQLATSTHTRVEPSPETDSAGATTHQRDQGNADQNAAATPPPATSTQPSPDEANSRAVATPQRSTSGGLFSSSSTTIHSDKIKRFALAKNVDHKEPVGELADVTLSRDNVATVFAYSEALDLKDETLRYVWTLNGNQVADVKVPVWSARWRSHSSKYVTATMRGDWKVELRDSSGDVLAMTEFQY